MGSYKFLKKCKHAQRPQNRRTVGDDRLFRLRSAKSSACMCPTDRQTDFPSLKKSTCSGWVQATLWFEL